MIELTPNQRQELKSSEPFVIDPETRETYVLVRKATYERLCGLVEGQVALTTAEMLDRVMAEDDEHDPYLARLQKEYGDTP